MKWHAVFCSLILLAAPALGADANPVKKGLIVHEWGVFRVNQDAEFANADLRAEWDSLPEFVYGHIKGRIVPQHWGAVEIRRRPIIFFHASEATTARVKVDFPGGMAGVWFPATEVPAVYGIQKQPKAGGSLLWNVGVKQCPQGWFPKQPNAHAVSDRHWISRIRQVKSDEIFARYSPNPADVEREKFIYYDGIFPQGRWLKIGVDNKRVLLTSKVKHDIFDVTIVDRRTEKIRIGRVAKMEAGATVEEVPFTEVEASRFLSDSSERLAKQLTGAGLYDDEAQSLVDLWKKELFETPGLNLFYRLAQAEYDARLPLTVTPKPESTVRVGLVYHAHLEPDFPARVLQLVNQLDSAKYSERDAAMKKLLAIGPAAMVQLQRMRDKNALSVEVRERIDALLKKWNARESFEDREEEPRIVDPFKK
jgi:hypothetical protein